VLRLMPYVLGFASAYDRWPWLSFAPFDLRLAVGPLLYLYLWRLATPALPPRWGWHLAPAALDLLYMLWAFALPLEQKHIWEAQVHGPWISPLQDAAGGVSLALYLVLAARLRRRYLDWLHEHVSDRDAQRQPWVASVLLALGLWLLVSTGFDLYSAAVAPLSYHDRFPQYLAFGHHPVAWTGRLAACGAGLSADAPGVAGAVGRAGRHARRRSRLASHGRRMARDDGEGRHAAGGQRLSCQCKWRPDPGRAWQRRRE
jgi:hypothetical protein